MNTFGSGAVQPNTVKFLINAICRAVRANKKCVERNDEKVL
jgi:hypothetical protein